MTYFAVRRCLALSSALVGMTVASCSKTSDHSVRINPRVNSFSLRFHISELEGQCYAPEAIVYNGNLNLDDFPGVNRWVLVRADPSQVGSLDSILSSRRVKIGSMINISVLRSEISKRPSYIQFIAFPCDAPTRSKAWAGKIPIVSVSADLPTFYPPGYRVPGASTGTLDKDGFLVDDAQDQNTSSPTDPAKLDNIEEYARHPSKPPRPAPGW